MRVRDKNTRRARKRDLKGRNERTYAKMAREMEARVTDILSQERKVLSLAKKTFGSTLTGSLRGLEAEEAAEEGIRGLLKKENQESRRKNSKYGLYSA